MVKAKDIKNGPWGYYNGGGFCQGVSFFDQGRAEWHTQKVCECGRFIYQASACKDCGKPASKIKEYVLRFEIDDKKYNENCRKMWFGLFGPRIFPDDYRLFGGWEIKT